MSKKFQLSRRTLLRGAGALMALPVLEQMLPATAHADPGSAPRRLAVFYTPNGIHMPKWTPSGTGASWALTPTLEPLAPVKNDPKLPACLTEHLLTYALGRGMSKADECAVREMAAVAEASGGSLSDYILSIVLSDHFTQRRGETEAQQP